MKKLFGRKCLLLLGLLIIGFSGSAQGATYYVSQSSGNDSWSGLAPAWDGTDGPRQTLLAAQRIIQNAVPGTKVLLKRGDKWTTPAGGNGVSLSGARGTETEPVVLGAYGTGNRPVLDVAATGTVIYSRGSDDPARSAYILIEGIHITSSLVPGQRPALGMGFVETYKSYGPHHITVRDCIVENLKYGIQAIGLTHDITIEESIIRNNYGLPPESGHTQGLYSNISGLVLRNNQFECNGKNQRCGAAVDSWFDHNIYLSNCRNCLVENNVFRRALDGIKIRRGDNITIRGNTIYDMNLMGLTAGADSDAQLNNTIIENNEIYDTSLGIAIKDQSGGAGYVNNMIIRNNIVRDPKIGPTYGVGPAYSFLTSSYSDGVYIYNNLFSGLRSRTGFSINDNSKSNVVLKNNMFLGTDASKVLVNLPSDLSGVELDHNLYFDSAGGNIINWSGGGYDLLDDFSSASGVETNGVQGDPLLNSNYSLSAASVMAIDTGADLAGSVNYDIAGNSRPQGLAWDIGPYEYISGSPVYQCNDGVDNDVDGLTDFPDDPGCSGPTDNDESSDGGSNQGSGGGSSGGGSNQGSGGGSSVDQNNPVVGDGSSGACFLSVLLGKM